LLDCLSDSLYDKPYLIPCVEREKLVKSAGANTIPSAVSHSVTMALPSVKKSRSGSGASVFLNQNITVYKRDIGVLLMGFALATLVFLVAQPHQQQTSDSGNDNYPLLRQLSTTTASNSNNGVGSLQLKTVGQIKQTAQLPCNYVHDGYYLEESNELLHQVYQTVFHDLQDEDAIPVVVEVGGHDGITKSLSLKASRCLGVNTILIEASPKNYGILAQSRAYDRTVNAALCDVDFVEIVDVAKNSGQTRVVETEQGVGGGISKSKNAGAARIACTTIDKELDQLRASLPARYQDKLVLAFLVLDVEGHEAIALRGIQKYTPRKMTMESNKFSKDEASQLEAFQTRHHLKAESCYYADQCYNFQNKGQYDPRVFYAARKKIPKHTAATSSVAEAYHFYGQSLTAIK